ncbi:RNA recognition motif 2-domain-containing protein [Syncephalastrum racemosum]|uniref:RNA recognition motif 2-domain-containing protein n=1 Tax=Syncephalastrum racemosum TaxID=13706 RepID=A0A1X2HAV0_SYNRA|nr:RNA recognition motif 2-domain-containing protein [Syncephalastrum racemosum]
MSYFWITGRDKRTTFMIKNIPNKYTYTMLKESIDATHAKTYDFLYLRMDYENKCNHGYAFINFIDYRSVISFAHARVGHRWNRFNSDKRCELAYATCQGRENLIAKFRNSTVMDQQESYRPKLYISWGPNRGKEEASEIKASSIAKV